MVSVFVNHQGAGICSFVQILVYFRFRFRDFCISVESMVDLC